MPTLADPEPPLATPSVAAEPEALSSPLLTRPGCRSARGGPFRLRPWLQRRWVRRTLWVAGGVLALAGLGSSRQGWAQYQGPLNPLQVDWRQPQAWVATPSLSGLVRDLTRAPVLRTVLTEDFVFHYEEHEERLALAGTLKRLAFEHDLSLPERLLEQALDGPAELAMWPDDRGALRHWALAMERGAATRLLQTLAPLAAQDLQLSRLGQLQPADGAAAVPVLALALSPRRTLALAARGDRLVVMSDPGLLWSPPAPGDAPGADTPVAGPDPAAAEVLLRLLSPRATEQAVWQQAQAVQPSPGRHELVARGPLLSLQYQHFFPGLQALGASLDLGGQVLETRVRVGGGLPASLQSQPPWAALPASPAACAALPVAWSRLQALGAAPQGTSADTPRPPEVLRRTLQGLQGPAAVCWYAGATLHTPLLVARSSAPAPDDATLRALAEWLLPEQAALRTGDGRALAQVPQRRAGQGTYHWALQRVGPWWLFSPDAGLVDRAVDTVARRYPSVADSLGASGAPGAVLAVVEPAELSRLLQAESLSVLGPRQASFRQAAQTRLFPQLQRLAELPATQVQLQGLPNAQGWMSLRWTALAAPGRLP
ncbi:DUF2138 family protein [Ideonella livida]|uniref:DUF2138 family protein n=1 Tax=Ideonella livida TaxID=2707176 RepID=A0A7C9PHN1_9BURK|nr:DUF2138 family protein [Ideonella livida]NDY91294.1 DUF2138 family protein [Ideonella livida]